ncbi:MAG: SDR family oxidoreductase [Bacillota bacterium]|nr:SDR family oxidoreductase [Bacillota bacterium]MDW7678138.1 SDR family oxidoreductase [Bacillota bacterium]
MFADKVVIVTGGAWGIGKVIGESFREEGAHVCVIDKLPNDYFVGDLAEEATLRSFTAKVIAEYGRVDFLINNAALFIGGIDNCSWDDFNYVLHTGVTAPFMLAKLLKDHFSKEAAIVNISSTRERMSQPNTESYSAAKGAIAALTHALAVSLAGKVRVNAVSPGWIDTEGSDFEPADNTQHPAGRVGNPRDIANLVLFLCSDKAGFITGENITVDGGMTKLMIYHGDHHWEYHPDPA